MGGPGESIADKEKITETKVTERMRDIDRSNMENPGANPNVQGVTQAPPQQQMAGPGGNAGYPQGQAY